MDLNDSSASVEASTRYAPDNPSLQNSRRVKQPLDGSSGTLLEHNDPLPSNRSSSGIKVILSTGDITIEHLDPETVAASPSRAVVHRWRVSSSDIMRSSPYFRALLDPHKFAEGKSLMHQKIQTQQLASESAVGSLDPPDSEQAWNTDELPVVQLPSDHFSSRLGTDVIELFLEVLSYDSYDDDQQRAFDARLRVQPVSLVSRLVELADAFNSPQAVQKALTQSGYAFGKGKVPLTKFDAASLLKLPEDRIRQTIFVARFLNEYAIVQVYTHTLVVMGSRYWSNGVVEAPGNPTFPWRYLAGGIEEELYFRRQCVLNTITDLQAHFLRAYGALEDATDDAYPSAAATTTSTSAATTTTTTTPQPRPPFSLPATSTTIHPRHFQCRYGFANSSACDVFHLGQMTRFFALRTKTIFLGSTLIDDPDFLLPLDDEDHDNEEADDDDANLAADHPPTPIPQQQQHQTNIATLLASLKQCPDYQIDTNHTGCGIRRRFLPPLDCIERFVGDARGLLGVNPAPPSSSSTSTSSSQGSGWAATTRWTVTPGSWANRSRPRALVLDVHLSRINAIPVLARGGGRKVERGVRVGSSQEENARLLFTARRRNWET
ncbi:uncharacterized protein BO95DRAFT_387550 [Aspergillus brunneoviolaceus CBS 621.78]|uniref:Uncharacterized protein n=1 Tax=Aspergillus brunneoviolaceus CBS 621.78 TaxID=1450534 RepID=A0ACD1GBQ8_9EURO|nr:hypothetical protein BO95DRAFT_387550 [Aspergillus brunneoviolaceus CBS 621.78]RAH46546.1 hypothetical protein BO95DRAFT_387550 [Aspergillus brunneoviolaceus CBS 621.78]